MNRLKKKITHFRRKLGMDSELNNSIEEFEKDLKSRTLTQTSTFVIF